MAEPEVLDGGVEVVGGVLLGASVLGAEPASGGFTAVPPEVLGFAEPVPLIEPLVPVFPDGAVVDAPGAAPPVAEGSLVAAAFVLAPVEAIPEPDHQSWLALCFGEARR